MSVPSDFLDWPDCELMPIDSDTESVTSDMSTMVQQASQITIQQASGQEPQQQPAMVPMWIDQPSTSSGFHDPFGPASGDLTMPLLDQPSTSSGYYNTFSRASTSSGPMMGEWVEQPSTSSAFDDPFGRASGGDQTMGVWDQPSTSFQYDDPCETASHYQQPTDTSDQPSTSSAFNDPFGRASGADDWAMGLWDQPSASFEYDDPCGPASGYQQPTDTRNQPSTSSAFNNSPYNVPASTSGMGPVCQCTDCRMERNHNMPEANINYPPNSNGNWSSLNLSKLTTCCSLSPSHSPS